MPSSIRFDGHSEKRESERDKSGRWSRRRGGSGGSFRRSTRVRLIQRSGKSIGQLAPELGIGETALRRWVDQAEVEAGAAQQNY